MSDDSNIKIIAFASFKGGCGKTTSLMATASMLVAHGNKVDLFEADQVAPLTKWKTAALKQNTWDELCSISPAFDMDSFENSYEKAVEKGTGYILIDTHGGASDLNQNIIINSDLVIVPSGLTDLDVKSTLDTMKYTLELFATNDLEENIALLWQRFPTGKLSVSEEAYLEQLAPLTQFTTRLHKRDAFTSIGSNGMLHRQHKLLSEDPKYRLKTRTFGVAVNEAENLTNEILQTLKVNKNAA